MKRSTQVTLGSVVVAAGLVILTLVVIVPVVLCPHDRELAREAICQANLYTIGKSLHIYLVDFGSFPLVAEHGDVDAELSARTMADEIFDSTGASNLGTNAMQNLWPIIEMGMSEKTFECPADPHYQERRLPGGLKRYGWIDKRNFSYGLHKPYDNDQGSLGRNKAPLSAVLDGNFVIMTDKNVAGRIYYKSDEDRNGPANHPDEGFACLTYQGAVEWHKTSIDKSSANSRAGIGGDDVYEAGDKNGTDYTNASHAAEADPTDDTDAFIVPW